MVLLRNRRAVRIGSVQDQLIKSNEDLKAGRVTDTPLVIADLSGDANPKLVKNKKEKSNK